MTSPSGLDSESRLKALEAAHEQAARLSSDPIDATGWPENIDAVTALVRSETVAYPNMGHECESGTTIVIQILGTFPGIAVGGGGGGIDDSGGADAAVHAVTLTADSRTGLVCLLSVQTGAVSADPEATIVFRR